MKDLAEIRKMPVPERLALVAEIWATILEDPESLPVPEQLARELERRLDAHRRSPDDARPWDEVEREIFCDE